MTASSREAIVHDLQRPLRWTFLTGQLRDVPKLSNPVRAVSGYDHRGGEVATKGWSPHPLASGYELGVRWRHLNRLRHLSMSALLESSASFRTSDFAPSWRFKHSAQRSTLRIWKHVLMYRLRQTRTVTLKQAAAQRSTTQRITLPLASAESNDIDLTFQVQNTQETVAGS